VPSATPPGRPRRTGGRPAQRGHRRPRQPAEHRLTGIAGRTRSGPWPPILWCSPRLADDRAAPIIAYLTLFEDSYARFPGFENEIQGVYPEQDEDGRVRLFTYVIRE
jgi:Orn/Lys/Arg decarboxylase, C-terminal domain